MIDSITEYIPLIMAVSTVLMVYLIGNCCKNESQEDENLNEIYIDNGEDDDDLTIKIFEFLVIIGDINIKGLKEKIDKQCDKFGLRKTGLTENQINLVICITLKDTLVESEKINIEIYEENDSDLGNNESRCIICLDTSKNKHLIKLQCGHVFHVKCLFKWLKYSSKCPYCKIKLFNGFK